MWKIDFYLTIHEVLDSIVFFFMIRVPAVLIPNGETTSSFRSKAIRANITKRELKYLTMVHILIGSKSNFCFNWVCWLFLRRCKMVIRSGIFNTVRQTEGNAIASQRISKKQFKSKKELKFNWTFLFC